MPEPVKFTPATLNGASFETASFCSPADSPLADIEYTGDPEADSANELGVVERTFREKAKREESRRLKATDSEYWVCLCFQTREQVESFLASTGWGARTDKYIDGTRVAAALGVEIPADTAGYSKPRIDATFASLSVELP